VKQYALQLLLFNPFNEYAARKLQENQEEMKLDGTHQLLVCTNDVTVVVDNTHTMKNAALIDGKKIYQYMKRVRS
jgi:hypothetical protein